MLKIITIFRFLFVYFIFVGDDEKSKNNKKMEGLM